MPKRAPKYNHNEHSRREPSGAIRTRTNATNELAGLRGGCKSGSPRRHCERRNTRHFERRYARGDKRISSQRVQPTVLDAHRIGNSTAVVVLFPCLKVPSTVKYGTVLLRCSLYRQHNEVCTTCGGIGHRRDVCPRPHAQVCLACGTSNPNSDQENYCKPKCKLCGGPPRPARKDALTNLRRHISLRDANGSARKWRNSSVKMATADSPLCSHMGAAEAEGAAAAVLRAEEQRGGAAAQRGGAEAGTRRAHAREWRGPPSGVRHCVRQRRRRRRHLPPPPRAVLAPRRRVDREDNREGETIAKKRARPHRASEARRRTTRSTPCYTKRYSCYERRTLS